MIEVVRGVVEGNRAQRPGGRLQGERRGVELDDRSAGAVSDRGPRVVAAADDAVADAELSLSEPQRVGAESAGAEHPRAGGLVEVADVLASVGEHHGSGEVALGCLPPVLEEASFDRERVVVEVESPALGRVGEVRLWIAGAQVGERGPLGGVALAAVLGQAERAEPIAERSVEPAGTDGGELAGVTDEDRLPVRLVDHAKQRREGARVGHAGLVDDEDAVGWEATVSGGVEEEAVEGGGFGCR